MNVNITGPRILAEFSFFGLCDVTITQTTLTSLLVLAAVTILCWRLGRNLLEAPRPHAGRHGARRPCRLQARGRHDGQAQ